MTVSPTARPASAAGRRSARQIAAAPPAPRPRTATKGTASVTKTVVGVFRPRIIPHHKEDVACAAVPFLKIAETAGKTQAECSVAPAQVRRR